MNKKQNNLFSILGIIVCSTLFVVGMLYAEQIPLLTIVGILGLVGMSRFVSHIVTSMMERKN